MLSVVGDVLASYPIWHGFAEPSFGKQHIPIVSGHGCWVTDASGREYLNAFSGLSLILGVGRPEIEQAISRQLHSLPYAHMSRNTTHVSIEAAEAILQLFPEPMGMAKVMFTVTGSEAVEGAIKIARQFHRLSGEPTRNLVVGLHRSYHGMGFGSASASGVFVNEAENAFGPLLPGTAIVRGPTSPRDCTDCRTTQLCSGACARGVEDFVTLCGAQRLAAIIIEPILGAGGAIVPAQDYFRRLSTVCKDNGILLIVDESATCCGRTGRMLGSEHGGLQGDIVVLSKAINGGYLPMGAVVCSQRIFDVFSHSNARLLHGGSQAGNPSCVAAVAPTLEIVRKEEIPQRAARAGRRLLDGLRSSSVVTEVADVTGIGLLVVIEAKEARPDLARFAAAIRKAGVLAYVGRDRLGFFPPLIINDAEIDFIVEAVHNAVSQTRKECV
jgi:putrescine aminotransferase